MSHIHILFTMLSILNITTNRLIASTTSKHLICQILMKFFSTQINEKKMRKTQKNAENAEKHAENVEKLMESMEKDVENVEKFAENCGF